MAFSYTLDENFETGGIGAFDSESDTNGILNIRHFRELARSDPQNLMPFRGAYAMEVDIGGATTNQYLQDDDYNISANATLYVRIVFALTSDVTMAASDRFTMFTLQNTSNVDESVIDIRNNAGVHEVLAAETGSASTVRAAQLILGEWHTAELTAHIDAGGGNDGTLDFYLDGVQVSTQITSLDQGAITHCRLGVIGKESGTSAGRLLVSEITADDGRLYPHVERFSNPRVITKNTSVFVGPGYVDSLEGLIANADNRWFLFDTDNATDWATDGTPDDLQGYVVEYQPALTAVGAPGRIKGPWHFKRGCYAYMTGTTPKFNVHLAGDSDVPGIIGPITQSEGGMRNWAMRTS